MRFLTPSTSRVAGQHSCVANCAAPAGRATMGTHMMQLEEGDTIASVARISVDLQEETNGGETAEPAASGEAGEPQPPNDSGG